MNDLKIPKWFWQLMILCCLVGAGFAGYYLIIDKNEETGYVWYVFLFLMALWYALRQMRKAD
ncbi:hypothetical protein [Nonlabens ponticola]|uniref:Uncharacterized protein n=1 Tax=Nonlabens ponticola TaxID=2496866 RepID=A0A3S9MWP8_9FLAO|nr:hypothetical protein [Nonlabens ponticola]AZQ43543.1 hypothetical protein EJ995_04575 [Nonlabens ponticola]